jgi:exonuclease SbcC
MKSLRPIEFFFLDEGFGTLDEKLVDTVMDVLGKLSKNFSVGLISHVEELKRRIENKIEVLPAGINHGSKILH